MLLGAALLAWTGAASAGDRVYTVALDPDLSRMLVEARFVDPVDRIAARNRDAARFLETPTDCDTGERLRTQGRRLILPKGGLHCLSYAVDLNAAAAAERARGVADDSLVAVSPSAWLWRPRLREAGDITVRFDLPVGTSVFVPWQPVAAAVDTFTVGPSPQSGNATAVFGSFRAAKRSLDDTEIRIALLADQGEAGSAALADWVSDAARNVALAYDRFPNRSVSVLLIPVGGNSWSDSAVPFGRVVRDGGESIEVLINENRPLDEFYADWTLTHEFAHLMLPYLSHEERWISEGFATYYQNLLLARAGRYSEATAWAKLVAGFERGQKSVPSLSPNAAASGAERNTRMKIYWSGAALALLADVELRRRSGGSDSLDSVLDKLQQCCLPSERSWSGPELFTKLDTLASEPVFMDLYRRYADRAGFPAIQPVLDELGVRHQTGGIRLDDSAVLAPVRRAMLARPDGSND